MKTALAALFLLALVPASASAESEYRACMKAETLMGGSAAAYFPGFARSGIRYDVNPGYYAFDSSFGGAYLRFGSSSYWSFAQNTRVLNQSYACRHLLKVNPPAYRVVGMKSPAQRTSTNVTGRKAAPRQVRPGFLPAGN